MTQRYLPLALALLFLSSFAPRAEAAGPICLLDGNGAATPGMPACPTRATNMGDDTAITTSYSGLRSNAGWTALTPIDVFNYCRYVDNSSTNGFFVPFNSAMEWSAFMKNFPTNSLWLTHCARPYDYPSAYGPTDVNFGMGDTGDPQTADQALPYWRTGQSWPPGGSASHTFNYSCYEEYSQYKCWNWVQQTCTACDSTDAYGNCTSSHDYDCSYCSDAGSTCEKNWYPWSEAWNFIAYALDSDTTNPSWSGTQSHSGSRPSQCNTRCTFTGHDCINCGAVAQDPSPTCTVADLHPYNQYTNFYCTYPGTTNTCLALSVVVINDENQISTDLAAGDTCGAASLRNAENSAIDTVNNLAQQWYMQYGAQSGG